jgi:hypothetical protein
MFDSLRKVPLDEAVEAAYLAARHIAHRRPFPEIDAGTPPREVDLLLQIRWEIEREEGVPLPEINPATAERYIPKLSDVVEELTAKPSGPGGDAGGVLLEQLRNEAEESARVLLAGQLRRLVPENSPAVTSDAAQKLASTCHSDLVAEFAVDLAERWLKIPDPLTRLHIVRALRNAIEAVSADHRPHVAERIGKALSMLSNDRQRVAESRREGLALLGEDPIGSGGSEIPQ